MNKTILIIEDNIINKKLFHDLLEAHGYDIVETENATEAIYLAKTANPCVILMDIQLPEISGVDLIKKMKAEESIKNIPIIAVTAFAMKDNEEMVMASGCDAYVAKPISIEPFIQLVNKYASMKAA